jgi:hypothetical protein
VSLAGVAERVRTFSATEEPLMPDEHGVRNRGYRSGMDMNSAVPDSGPLEAVAARRLHIGSGEREGRA